MNRSLCFIENPSRDPAFSLAAEEIMLSEWTAGDFFMLWINRPSVIVGKFQNPYGEVSLLACREAGTPVVRRNSGGGCVYHDGGNLNFTVVTDRPESPDYARFLAPVVGMLRRYGVDARITDGNALTAGGRKISGNAQSNAGNRVLHHGTLLFDADLDALSRLTGHARANVVSRAIPSRPSPVADIAPLLAAAGCPMTMDGFAAAVRDAFAPTCGRTFTEEERARIEALADAKYRTWEWNFGKSPAFVCETPEAKITAKGGVILAAETALCDPAALVGLRLIPETVEAVSPEVAALLFG